LKLYKSVQALDCRSEAKEVRPVHRTAVAAKENGLTEKVDQPVKPLYLFSPPFISGQGDEGRPVPDLDWTIEVSVLLISPLALTSVRKLELVTGIPDCA
jgi:hypothetical protein